jgi:hypothetical protein
MSCGPKKGIPGGGYEEAFQHQFSPCSENIYGEVVGDINATEDLLKGLSVSLPPHEASMVTQMATPAPAQETIRPLLSSDTLVGQQLGSQLEDVYHPVIELEEGESSLTPEPQVQQVFPNSTQHPSAYPTSQPQIIQLDM